MARAQSESVAADATYDNGEFLQWLVERGITPYMKIGGVRSFRNGYFCAFTTETFTDGATPEKLLSLRIEDCAT